MKVVFFGFVFALVVVGALGTAHLRGPRYSTKLSFGNGVNFQPAYYCNGDQNLGWNLINSYPNIKTVRIELETAGSADFSDFSRWIQEAQNNGKEVIATYHRYQQLGSTNVNDLLNAAYWWKDNYYKLGGNFIINLMNEWGDHTVTPTDYANAYNQAIAIVREVYNGPLIIDIPGWGQEFYTAADASPLIYDKNIIFSAHIYPQAYDSRSGTPTKLNIDYLHNTGRPCMLGEFGSDGTSGADWSGLVDYARSLGWSVLGWAWNGDGGNMNMISPSWGESCSTTNYSPTSYFYTIYNKL